MTSQQKDFDFWFDFLLGGVSKGISKTCKAPFDRIQLLLQTQDANKKIQDGVFVKYRGIINCFQRIRKEEGAIALFRGNVPNILRYFPAEIMNFTFKESIKKTFSNYNQTRPFLFFLEKMIQGGVAGAMTLLVVYPFDFARVRLAADIGRNTERQFLGFTHCLNSILKSDGFNGLYRGFGVSVLGVVVYRAIYFGAYDLAHATVFQQPSFENVSAKFAIAYLITVCAGTLSYPLDTIRKRMMMQSGQTDVLSANTLDCATKIWRNEGMRGFFKGFLMNFLSGFSAILLVWFDKISEEG